jgi:hypothetical protein
MIRKHALELKKQIAINEEKKQLSQKMYLEEGRKIKETLSENTHILERIKSEKREQLVRLGIPEKYRV